MAAVDTIFAGIVATGAMSLVMAMIHLTGWANADMIRALGSLVTRSYERSLMPGLFVHFTSGALFAFPYALILSGLGMSSTAALAGVGALMGFVHGFVMTFVLIAIMCEKHPLERFRKAGMEVAVAHLLGHVAYGAALGVMVGVMGIRFSFFHL
jgi:hypothetical protein